jgi:prephenate dehydrogenase
LEQEAIDGEIEADRLDSCDLVIVSLHPIQTIDVILDYKDKFRKGGIVIDTCGVKEEIVKAVEMPLADSGVNFVGCHPMAGREFSGFAYSVDNLFEKASFIMTPTNDTSPQVIKTVSDFALETGFAKVVVSNTQEHDEIIAYTSQLAHVVSSSYVKSPSLLKQSGFSAGSFKDLTRVAKLNEDMWTPLFLMNKKPLVEDLDHIIARLSEYRDAIDSENSQQLHRLLKEGRELKELSNAASTK